MSLNGRGWRVDLMSEFDLFKKGILRPALVFFKHLLERVELSVPTP
jgi:hypothetical protein